ncbi:MAG: RuBisCO large subunit C-terminal-like domain-containing protein [Myxococcota bacterium]|nr:RuBisCO large subunit C-terminal-like domain-containing protein [Myxococcota bacterium]
MARGLSLSGERFAAVYRIVGSQHEAAARAEDICVEQTVEYPQDLIDRSDIRTQIFGRVSALQQIDAQVWEATIEFPVEVAGGELTQLLNVLFGNISLKPGIRLSRCSLPQGLTSSFKGPRFGTKGLRELLGIPHRPILCSALKPMGLSAQELAELSYCFAKGGIDLIKDDHGIADQSFCRFDERVTLCAAAVQKANQETGYRCRYLPNVSAPADLFFKRVRTAKQAGAGGLLIAPGLVGFDTMRQVADDDEIDLPILSHPALLGSFTISATSGISHGPLYGLLNRLAGADGVIFPSFGGRFTFSKADCRDIVLHAAAELGDLAPIFPVPAGGMTLNKVPGLLQFYGQDVILLIGGDLHRHSADLVESCRQFRQLVEAPVTASPTSNRSTG